MLPHRGYGSLLVRSKCARKPDNNGLPRITFVNDLALDAVVAQQAPGSIKAATRKRDVLGKVFRAADNARLVPNREAHRLRPVEFGILKGGETD